MTEAQEWKEKWTPKTLYRFWNARYFRGKLPDIPVVWSKKEFSGRRKRLLGSAFFDGLSGKPVSIQLNPLYRRATRIWMQTLLHEMVHVQQWRVPAKQAHGNKFNARMKQLAAQGAFRSLW